MAATGFFAPLHRRFFWCCFCLCKPKGAGCSSIALGWTILIILLGLTADIVGENPLRPPNRSIENDRSNIGKICNYSVDIRNTIDQFEKLRGCSVVEGFVQILLFDNVNESLFSNISFPELTEITDYLLSYRVNGLRNLGQLFPNLAVIRGQKTFFGYAFVVFEMSSLQEIGLYSLTDITHGLIRVDKNPSLCFVNSIEWDSIAHERGDHFIKSIKPENECPICPGDDVTDEGSGSNITACPQASHKSGSDDSHQARHLCWNRQHCQKICPKHCKACDKDGNCCNPNCLGGCTDKVCHVCRKIAIGVGPNRECQDECPRGLYEYLGRRCITKEQCINLKRPFDLHGRFQQGKSYKIFQKSCVLDCPVNYMDDYENHTCAPCAGRCKKECPGTSVDSIASAQQLRGCTHIKGSLEIQIRGGRNIVNELEENLNMIEEIDGYIKIVRSFPLISLNFLKNLKVLGGTTLESQKYVFVVLDNQNLQELWDWENRTLRIDNGKLFFHFNPKLCYLKILKLREVANLAPFSDLEVAPTSNGDKIACNLQWMNVSIISYNSKAVILEWQPFKMDDHRKLLGYVVYSIEAPYQNVTLYDGRDACGGDGWRVDDVPNTEDNNSSLHYLLAQLKPYTQYAFYVKTYTIATEQSGARSKISYFTTLPDVPSKPLNLQVKTNTSSSLSITWQPPQSPNGNVTHYIVSGQQHKDTNTEELLKNRNYCTDPPTKPHSILQVPPSSSVPSPKNKNNDTCSCDDTKPTTKFTENDIISQINFEDALQNQVYIKKAGAIERRKREMRDFEDQYSFPANFDSPAINSVNNTIQNITENGTDVFESFTVAVYGKTELYLTNLRHFTFYNIHVQACREREGEDDKRPSCSDISIFTARTQKKAGADNVTDLRVANQSADTVTITWEEPPEPNGLILTYQIEYKRMDIEHSQSILQCITRTHFLNQKSTYTLKQLNPGNYSLRLMATSRAANGDYSQYIYFLIDESSTISSTQIFLYAFGAVGVALAIALIALYIFRRKFGAPVPSMKLIASINPEYVSTVYVPDDWEVPRKMIELIKELGQGSFGMVYEGIARDIKGKPEIRCAVKTVNEHATNRERIEFLNEASVMKAFDTAHVVRLLGVVSQGQPTLVIMELMANGDLKSYLRSHRPDADTYTGRQPPTLKRILQMAIEIADGMAYLAAKKFVHRDLAARNCMVAEDLTVKIGDFGMTRDIYETDYYRKGTKGLLPVRWMAPESLKDGVFTSSSDVWSYGVVLWEMATLASQPYQGLSNDQVLRYVIDGGVMERPENCPDKLYSLMRYCWQHKPLARPTFLELAGHLVDDATPNFSQISFYHSAAGIEARNSYPTPSPSQDDPSTPLRMVRDLDEDFSLGSSEAESELEIGTDTRIDFPAFPPASKDGSTTVNGYVSGHPTNGTATTQC